MTALRVGAETAEAPIENCVLVAGSKPVIAAAEITGMPCIVLRNRYYLPWFIFFSWLYVRCCLDILKLILSIVKPSIIHVSQRTFIGGIRALALLFKYFPTYVTHTCPLNGTNDSLVPIIIDYSKRKLSSCAYLISEKLQMMFAAKEKTTSLFLQG